MWRVTIKGLLAHKLRLALTGLAIVLGVTFIAGTFVLTDTLHSTFDTLFSNIYQNVDFQVRGVAQLGSGGGATRNPVPESVLATVRAVPGVEVAEGAVAGTAQFISHDGTAISTGGAPTLGVSWDPAQQLSPLRLAAGGPPTTPHDVVMDLGTAKKYGFSVGQQVRILLRGPTQTFTISGLTRFGTADNLAGATLAAFQLPTAQRILGQVGKFDAISVVAQPGADKAQVQRAIARALPRGVEVVTGQTVVNEQTSQVSQALGIFNTALLVFGFIALFVGGFTILNTFSIIVGQRTRELALLRIVGASRRQVFRSVLGEAAIVGLVSSLVGLGLGVLAAIGLEALLSGFGVTLPSGPIVFEARTVIVCLIVGVGVTLVAAISPARRAVRIAPVAAVSEQQTEAEIPLRAPHHLGSGHHRTRCARPRLRPDETSDRVRGTRRASGLRGRDSVGAGGGPPDGERHRAPAGAAARHVGPARTRELHAQPAPHRPDRLGADGGPGARLRHRRVRRGRCRARPRRASSRPSGRTSSSPHRTTARAASAPPWPRVRRPSPGSPRRPPSTRTSSSCRGRSRA